MTTGKNLFLKPSQVLFRQGDPSNGMYIIRKGLLVVYLESESSETQDTEKPREVELARMPSGSIVGEMALFDQKPRSASVRALEASEVTLVSTEDFATLLKQIPKWFTLLMSTLSGRLRSTNERLEKFERKTAPALSGTKSLLRTLVVIDLLFYRNGEKDSKENSKEWLLDTKVVSTTLTTDFEEEPKRLEKILALLERTDLFKTKRNAYNALCYVTPNRGYISKFVTMLEQHIQQNPDLAYLETESLNILKTIKLVAEQNSYEVSTLALPTLIEQGKKLGYQNSAKWSDHVSTLRNLTPCVSLVKIPPEGLGFRYEKKLLKDVIQFHEILAMIVSSL